MIEKQFNSVVSEIKATLDKKGNHLDMVSLFVTQHEETLSHYFKDKSKVDIRSIAKPITCLAVGAAINKGLYFNKIKIELDTPIWQFLKNYSNLSNQNNLKQLEKLTLLDCFRITLGHDKGIMFSSDVKEQNENELVDYIINFPITKEIGKNFIYSNAGTFLISSLITEYCDINLDEFVNIHLFKPLEIKDYNWKKYGKYTAGCTGLELHNIDLHKIGLLLLNDGKYNGSQIVPSEWVELMKTPQVSTPTHRYIGTRAFPKWSYGMNLWICENGNYYCDGSDSQYLIINPSKRIVITCMGYQKDSEPVSNILGVWK